MAVRYTIYSHADTDGAVAAALLFTHLQTAFGEDLDLQVRPVDHGDTRGQRGGGWSMVALTPPCAVLDFSLHPSMMTARFASSHPEFLGRGGSAVKSYWIDHHETGSPFSFLRPGDTDRYFDDRVCTIWDPTASSTPALMRRESARLGLNTEVLDSFSYLIDIADIVDAARFESAEAAHDFSEFSVRLQHLVTSQHPLIDRTKLYRRLVADMVRLGGRCRTRPADAALVWHALVEQDPIYVPLLEHEERQLHLRRRAYQRVARRHRNVVVCDFRKNQDLWCGLGRFIPYELTLEAQYAVHIAPANRFGECAVTCGVNPWNRGDSLLHIGRYFARELSGGGHAFVAGGQIHNSDSSSVDRLIEHLLTGTDSI